jgi:hypothetical protein
MRAQNENDHLILYVLAGVTIRHHVPRGPPYTELSAHLDRLPFQGCLDRLHCSTLCLHISPLCTYFFPLFSMLSFLSRYYHTIGI